MPKGEENFKRTDSEPTASGFVTYHFLHPDQLTQSQIAGLGLSDNDVELFEACREQGLFPACLENGTFLAGTWPDKISRELLFTLLPELSAGNNIQGASILELEPSQEALDDEVSLMCQFKLMRDYLSLFINFENIASEKYTQNHDAKCAEIRKQSRAECERLGFQAHVVVVQAGCPFTQEQVLGRIDWENGSTQQFVKDNLYRRISISDQMSSPKWSDPLGQFALSWLLAACSEASLRAGLYMIKTEEIDTIDEHIPDLLGSINSKLEAISKIKGRVAWLRWIFFTKKNDNVLTNSESQRGQ